MATSTVKLNNRKPIGMTLPIKLGDNGYFEQSYDTLSQIKSNIINLLNTKPGERRMQPTFYCRLHNLVFEQNMEVLPEIASNIVKEDIQKWISGVTVTNVTADVLKNNESSDNVDIYKLYIAVKFTVNATGQTSTIELTLDNTLL
jgi:phage baseplate assembly protein W